MKGIDKHILNIALPSIVSNITVPLLGLVDVTIVGHLGNAAYIGAIAVGSMLFNIIYWLFAFLRMGTSGMTAQLYGKHSSVDIVQMAVRSIGIGMAAAFALIVLQVPIREMAFLFIRPTEEIKELVGKARFTVVPSEWYENNPLSVIEALCLGTPVLGARIGGIPELIEEGVAGMTFDSGNADDLTNKIGRMFSTSFNYAAIAEKASSSFGADGYYHKLMDLYKKQIKQNY